MAQRALATEDKQARRSAILSAARHLFNAGTGELPTASQIATASGLAKGTLYLYFQTKEEIFANLLLEGWIPAMDAADRVFQATEGTRSDKVQAFIDNLIHHLDSHPGLLRLDSLGPGVLEKNMTPEALRAYKLIFTGHLLQAGSCIDRVLVLNQGRGVQILMRTYALARGLWQSAQHDEQSLTMGVAPALMLTPDAYLQELREALTEYWRGALT